MMPTVHSSKRLPGDTSSRMAATMMANSGGSAQASRPAAISVSSWRISQRPMAASTTAVEW
jgi:hypothetical protein